MYGDAAELGFQTSLLDAERTHAADAFLAGVAPREVAANPALLKLASAHRVLLLQGPVGPFFDRLAGWLQARGARVSRVALHGGDRADCQAVQPIPFQGSPAEWPQFLDGLLAREAPDCVVLFGQSRWYHAVARELAPRRGAAVIVTEEGYVRPGYLTMELGGVNGLSTTLGRFRWERPAGPSPGLATALRLGHAAQSEPWLWQKMALHAGRHYLALSRGRGDFPHYQHHRDTSVPRYSAFWAASLLRKYLHALPDRAAARRLKGTPYFFVPLQLEGDAQISQHSPYASNAGFVREVLHSFAAHAPADARLVFKQHPHARGGRGEVAAIRSQACSLGIGRRVVHLVEGHTPSLVEDALGVVVINSTVGLQALVRRRPLKVMGEALYALPGLVYQGALDGFWTSVPAPDAGMARNFIEQLLHLTQVPCHTYAGRHSPLEWRLPEDLQDLQDPQNPQDVRQPA